MENALGAFNLFSKVSNLCVALGQSFVSYVIAFRFPQFEAVKTTWEEISDVTSVLCTHNARRTCMHEHTHTHTHTHTHMGTHVLA